MQPRVSSTLPPCILPPQPRTRHCRHQLDVKALAHAVAVDAVEQDLARAQVLNRLAESRWRKCRQQRGFNTMAPTRMDAKDHLLWQNQQTRPDPLLPHLRQLHRVHIATLAPALDRALPPAPLLAIGPWCRTGSKWSGSVSSNS